MRPILLVTWAFVAMLCSCNASSACNTTTCGGCCDSTGQCQKGTEATACGATGSMCQSCTSAQICAQHTCQAGSAATGGGSSSTGGGSATGGGTTSTGGGTATGGGTTATGGGSTGTGGGSGAKPPQVTVTAGSCQTVTPCTGDLVGTWFYSVACADDPLADVRKNCAGLTTVSSNSKLSGRFDFTATTVTRVVDTTYATTVNLPPSCTPVGCSVIESVLQNSVPTASCSSASNGGCDCSLSGSSNLTESGTWSSAGGVLTIVTPTKTRTFDSCVMTGIAPTSMRLRETSTTSGTEQGTTTLLKQP